MFIKHSFVTPLIVIFVVLLPGLFSFDIIGKPQLMTHATHSSKSHEHFLTDTAHNILQKMTSNNNVDEVIILMILFHTSPVIF